MRGKAIFNFLLLSLCTLTVNAGFALCGSEISPVLFVQEADSRALIFFRPLTVVSWLII